MNDPPASIAALLNPFEGLVDSITSRKAKLLAVGATLAPSKRTVTSALSVMDLRDRRDFSLCRQVLNRARWSPLKISRALLPPLIERLDTGDGPSSAWTIP